MNELGQNVIYDLRKHLFTHDSGYRIGFLTSAQPDPF